MGKYTANELSTFFRKSGNRFVFENGLTLNQLALTIDGIVDYEVDAGVLSKVISGDRPLLNWLLDALCEALAISDCRRHKLEYAMAQDLCGESGIETHIVFNPPVVTFLTRDIARISRARKDGNLMHALRFLSDFYILQRELIPLESNSPLVIRVLSLLQEERELLMQDIAATQWSHDVSATPVFDLSGDDAWLADMPADIDRALLNKLARTTAPLSEIERQIWKQRYEEQHDEVTISKLLNLEVATVFGLLYSTRQTLMKLVYQHHQSSEVK